MLWCMGYLFVVVDFDEFVVVYYGDLMIDFVYDVEIV